MNKRHFLIVLFALLWTVSGCNQDPKSGAGFRLPDGDANQGREVFLWPTSNSAEEWQRSRLTVTL